MNCLTADDLIILMTFTRYQNEIATACFSDRLIDRFCTITNFAIGLYCFASTLFSIAKYLIWILSARIVRSEYYNVTQCTSSFTHWRPFGSIAITTTSKNSNNLSSYYLTRSFQNIQQGIIAVCIVN